MEFLRQWTANLAWSLSNTEKQKMWSNIDSSLQYQVYRLTTFLWDLVVQDAWILKGYKNGNAVIKPKNNYTMNMDFRENIKAIPEWIGDHVRQTYSHGETGGQR